MNNYIIPSSNNTHEFENISINEQTNNIKEKILLNSINKEINCFLSYEDDNIKKLDDKKYLINLETYDIKKIQKHNFFKIETESVESFFINKNSKHYALFNLNENLDKIYSKETISEAYLDIIEKLNINNEIDNIIEEKLKKDISKITLKNNNGEYKINNDIKEDILNNLKEILIKNNQIDINEKLINENIKEAISDFIDNNNSLSKEFHKTFDYENNYSMIKTISFSETKNDGLNSELNYINTHLFLEDIKNNKFKNVLFAKYDESIVTDDKDMPFMFHGETLERLKKIKENPEIIIFTKDGKQPEKIDSDSIKILFNKKSNIFNKIKNKLINTYGNYRENFITKFFKKPSYENKREKIIAFKVKDSFDNFGKKLIKNTLKFFDASIKNNIDHDLIWRQFVKNCNQYDRDKILFSTKNNYFDLIDSEIQNELKDFIINKFEIKQENILSNHFKKEFDINNNIYYSVNVNNDTLDIIKKYEKIKNMNMERGFSDIEINFDEVNNNNKLKNIFALKDYNEETKIIVKEGSHDENMLINLIREPSKFKEKINEEFVEKRDELIFLKNEMFYRDMINDNFDKKIDNEIIKEIILYNKEKFIDYNHVDSNPDSSFLYPERDDIENIIRKTKNDLNLNIKTTKMKEEEKIENEKIENYINSIGKDTLISNFKKGFRVKRFEMNDINKTMKEIIESKELKEEIRKISMDTIENRLNIPNENINNIFNILKEKFENKEYIRVNKISNDLS